MSFLVETASVDHRARLTEQLRDSSTIPNEVSTALRTDNKVRQAHFSVAVHTVGRLLINSHSPCTAWAWFVGQSHQTDPAPNQSDDDRLAGLLPYVLDSFGETTRRAVMMGRASLAERTRRKATGTFYTPGDVARELAADTISAETSTVLDPACGAGVFLRAAFTELAKYRTPEKAVNALWGIDRNPIAVDAAALVLLHDWILRTELDSGESPIDRFLAIRSQLRAADALNVFASQRPLVANDDAGTPLPERFDAVLLNPPFAPGAPVTAARDFESLSSGVDSNRVSLVWPFWELASRVVSSQGRAGIVLPLSAAYLDSPSANAARHVAFQAGQWELRFFDRTPDGIFGDDVKQRIVFAIRTPARHPRLVTSSLRRWSSNERQSALARPSETVRQTITRNGIRKIGSSLERDAVDALLASGAVLGDGLEVGLASASSLPDGATSCAIAPTAYNWIGAYRTAAAARESRREAKSKLIHIRSPTDDIGAAVYALIVSRVFLWWWRVNGDLFHITRTDITHAPFPIARCDRRNLAELAAAGRRAWRRALQNPVVATNGGVTTTAFPLPGASPEARRVDDRVAIAFGLDPAFVRLAREDAVRLETAGRTLNDTDH